LLASDGSSVDFFKAGVTTAYFNEWWRENAVTKRCTEEQSDEWREL